MSSLLNISLFWTNIAQAKSVGYRPRSRGGSIGGSAPPSTPGSPPPISPANGRLPSSPPSPIVAVSRCSASSKETASGARNNRLTRHRVLQLAQVRRIDAVLVTELSRWGRSTQDLLDTLYQLAGWKVSLAAINGMTFELNTPHGRIMATLLAGIAQFERDLLSERVKSGLAAQGTGQETRPSARPAPQIRSARPEGAPCHRRREELSLDRPRPRHQQKHRRRHRQTASGKPLA